MIRDSLLKANQTVEESFLVDWLIPLDLFYFNGHFHNQPVLPAVAVIDISLQFMNSRTEKSYSLKSVKHAKFSAPLRPEQRVQIEYSANGSLWFVTWKNPSTGETYADLSLAVF